MVFSYQMVNFSQAAALAYVLRQAEKSSFLSSFSRVFNDLEQDPRVDAAENPERRFPIIQLRETGSSAASDLNMNFFFSRTGLPKRGRVRKLRDAKQVIMLGQSRKADKMKKELVDSAQDFSNRCEARKEKNRRNFEIRDGTCTEVLDLFLDYE